MLRFVCGFRGLPFQSNRALVRGERWTMAAACRGPDRWKAGNTRCWLHPPRAAFAPPAREPCSGSSGMSLGMTTDKTARNSPSQRNARFQLRSSGTRAGRRRVQAGALVRALRLQDDDARRAPAQWSCRRVETVKGSDPSTTPRRLIMLYGKNAGRRTGSAGRPWSRLAPHAVPRPSPNAGAAPAFPALVKRREPHFSKDPRHGETCTQAYYAQESGKAKRHEKMA